MSIIKEIAEKKMDDLNANDVDQAAKIIAGTARSMGYKVVEGGKISVDEKLKKELLTKPTPVEGKETPKAEGDQPKEEGSQNNEEKK